METSPMPNPWIWLRHKLGLNADAAAIQSLHQQQTNLIQEVSSLRAEMGGQSRALGQIVAKLNPALAMDELDPARKAASDKLSEDIIRKLVAEHITAKRYG